MKFKSGKDTYLINFTVKGAPAYGKKSNWNAVNVSFGVREEQDDYSFGDEISTDLTARNKNQFLIYSTVINAVRKFITEYNTEIDEIIMQGAGERQAVMYQRFFQSAGKYFPGWHYDGKHSLVRDVPRQPAKKVREQGVAEGIEFFSMPLRMSEYRGKAHPATNQPYDAKFKFSGDLKDRVHGLLDAGTKPTLLQVNPRHLLATQDWLSNQGGGKPAFATMKQHPVVLQKNNKLYILDGHHRSADAHKSGTPIQVYLFKDEL